MQNFPNFIAACRVHLLINSHDVYFFLFLLHLLDLAKPLRFHLSWISLRIFALQAALEHLPGKHSTFSH